MHDCGREYIIMMALYFIGPSVFENDDHCWRSRGYSNCSSGRRWSPAACCLCNQKGHHEKEFGSVRQTRDFMALGEESNTTFKRGLNSRRRKCELIFNDSITSPMREQLKAGMFGLFRDACS